MALTRVRSNKMRSLLTMLGIIIGIAAVIAIETVGNSMTGSVMDSMSGMGASNISVTVTQKSSSDTSGTSQGVQLRRFMDSKPSDADLITDAMINDFTAAFPTQVHHIELTQQVGSGTTAKYGDPTTTITATVSGINHAALAARDDDSQILYGRWLDDDRDAGRKVACVSEKFVEQAIGGSAQDAIGKAVTLTINQNLYTFYIQGVYKYTEDSYSGMYGGSDDDSIQTDFYIPLDVAKAIAGAGAGYQSITVVANGGTVNVTDFVNTVGDFFASYYTRNDSWTVSASSPSRSAAIAVSVTARVCRLEASVPRPMPVHARVRRRPLLTRRSNQGGIIWLPKFPAKKQQAPVSARSARILSAVQSISNPPLTTPSSL